MEHWPVIRVLALEFVEVYARSIINQLVREWGAFMRVRTSTRGLRRTWGWAAQVLAALVAVSIFTEARPQVLERPIPGDPVTIESGRVAGTLLPSGVRAYLGVPFAAPPLRERRWQPPGRPEPWTGIRYALRAAPECIQTLRAHDINHYFGEEATSEDCLYMNIWAPASSNANSRLPVIVFIYGGGGTIGSSRSALYAGETMAKRGAVFVNFNYRVGILGFMAHPELTKEQGGHSGNYAYL